MREKSYPKPRIFTQSFRTSIRRFRFTTGEPLNSRAELILNPSQLTAPIPDIRKKKSASNQ